MATRWIDRIVELKGDAPTGRMRVVEVEVDRLWVGCVPIDPDSVTYRVAKAAKDDVLWFRTQDLRECESQEERLL